MLTHKNFPTVFSNKGMFKKIKIAFNTFAAISYNNLGTEVQADLVDYLKAPDDNIKKSLKEFRNYNVQYQRQLVEGLFDTIGKVGTVPSDKLDEKLSDIIGKVDKGSSDEFPNDQSFRKQLVYLSPKAKKADEPDDEKADETTDENDNTLMSSEGGCKGFRNLQPAILFHLPGTETEVFLTYKYIRSLDADNDMNKEEDWNYAIYPGPFQNHKEKKFLSHKPSSKSAGVVFQLIDRKFGRLFSPIKQLSSEFMTPHRKELMEQQNVVIDSYTLFNLHICVPSEGQSDGLAENLLWEEWQILINEYRLVTMGALPQSLIAKSYAKNGYSVHSKPCDWHEKMDIKTSTFEMIDSGKVDIGQTPVRVMETLSENILMNVENFHLAADWMGPEHFKWLGGNHVKDVTYHIPHFEHILAYIGAPLYLLKGLKLQFELGEIREQIHEAGHKEYKLIKKLQFIEYMQNKVEKLKEIKIPETGKKLLSLQNKMLTAALSVERNNEIKAIRNQIRTQVFFFLGLFLTFGSLHLLPYLLNSKLLIDEIFVMVTVNGFTETMQSVIEFFRGPEGEITDQYLFPERKFGTHEEFSEWREYKKNGEDKSFLGIWEENTIETPIWWNKSTYNCLLTPHMKMLRKLLDVMDPAKVPQEGHKHFPHNDVKFAIRDGKSSRANMRSEILNEPETYSNLYPPIDNNDNIHLHLLDSIVMSYIKQLDDSSSKLHPYTKAHNDLLFGAIRQTQDELDRMYLKELSDWVKEIPGGTEDEKYEFRANNLWRKMLTLTEPYGEIKEGSNEYKKAVEDNHFGKADAAPIWARDAVMSILRIELRNAYDQMIKQRTMSTWIAIWLGEAMYQKELGDVDKNEVLKSILDNKYNLEVVENQDIDPLPKLFAVINPESTVISVTMSKFILHKIAKENADELSKLERVWISYDQQVNVETLKLKEDKLLLPKLEHSDLPDEASLLLATYGGLEKTINSGSQKLILLPNKNYFLQKQTKPPSSSFLASDRAQDQRTYVYDPDQDTDPNKIDNHFTLELKDINDIKFTVAHDDYINKLIMEINKPSIIIAQNIKLTQKQFKDELDRANPKIVYKPY